MIENIAAAVSVVAAAASLYFAYQTCCLAGKAKK